MNKLIITIVIIFLLVLILCLKISLIEYFTSDNKIDTILKKMETDFGIKIDIDQVKKLCPNEYNQTKNDKAVKKLLDNLLKNPGSPITMSLITKMPKCLDKLQTCIIDNGIMDVDMGKNPIF
jgi:hypothetical protein